MADLAQQIKKLRLEGDECSPPKRYTLDVTKTELGVLAYALCFTYPETYSNLAARIDKLYSKCD